MRLAVAGAYRPCVVLRPRPVATGLEGAEQTFIAGIGRAVDEAIAGL